MKEIKAPGFVSSKEDNTLFLAGSIEMGAAEMWQERVAKGLAGTDYVLLNPRRDDWDSSWEQTIANDKFREQVEWELQGLEEAQKVLVYFDPNTKAPITLLEIGFIVGFHDANAIEVVCPAGFYRKGNVDIFCKRHGIRQHDTLEEAITWLKRELKGDPA